MKATFCCVGYICYDIWIFPRSLENISKCPSHPQAHRQDPWPGCFLESKRSHLVDEMLEPVNRSKCLCQWETIGKSKLRMNMLLPSKGPSCCHIQLILKEYLNAFLKNFFKFLIALNTKNFRPCQSSLWRQFHKREIIYFTAAP